MQTRRDVGWGGGIQATMKAAQFQVAANTGQFCRANRENDRQIREDRSRVIDLCDARASILPFPDDPRNCPES